MSVGSTEAERGHSRSSCILPPIKDLCGNGSRKSSQINVVVQPQRQRNHVIQGESVNMFE